MTDTRMVLSFTPTGLRQLIDLEQEQVERKQVMLEVEEEKLELLKAEIAGHRAQVRIYQRALREREENSGE